MQILHFSISNARQFSINAPCATNLPQHPARHACRACGGGLVAKMKQQCCFRSIFLVPVANIDTIEKHNI
jgi:hypothetical protein